MPGSMTLPPPVIHRLAPSIYSVPYTYLSRTLKPGSPNRSDRSSPARPCSSPGTGNLSFCHRPRIAAGSGSVRCEAASISNPAGTMRIDVQRFLSGDF